MRCNFGFGCKTVGCSIPTRIITCLLEISGNGKTLFISGEMYRVMHVAFYWSNGKLIRENPELVKEIIRIHIKATEFIERES